jgi:hypothetical protein
VRTARLAARAIGWVFVAVIGYHAVLAAIRAAQAGSDGNWGRVVEMSAIALVGTALVILAAVGAARASRR